MFDPGFYSIHNNPATRYTRKYFSKSLRLMPSLELTVEQVIELVKQLPPHEKHAVLSVLNSELDNTLDSETKTWLESDLGENLPPYDWGVEGVPAGQPVLYVPEFGLLIDEEAGLAQEP
ncbi:MAG: hypothetical protein HC833_19315 [Leptolyngbyaceae cyanobacterium RM1_406_9]|nr:hypothetical protein [Leptolyngbyaceae cyanobacterium RM1_406_9]